MTFDSENDRYQRFSRRTLMLGGFQAFLMTGLLGRLYYLGVVQADQYKTLSDNNRLSLRLIPPVRGKIFDRHGNELAINRKDFRVHLVPEMAEDVNETLASLSRIIDLDVEDIERILKKISRQPKFVPVTVAENLDWKKFSKVNVATTTLPGVRPVEAEARFYPEAELVSHLVGYVASPNEEEVRADPVLQLPGFKIGKQGFERGLEEDLRGRAGTSNVEVNAFGRVVREVGRNEGQEGTPVTLTIDLELQRFAAQRLGDESAAAVIMDIYTGDVLAAVSTPSFNPNDFTTGISQSKFDGLQKNIKKPLFNKFLQGQYPPGSTFKMIVAIAALEEGLIDDSERIHCTGKVELGSSTFHCWKKGGHGGLNLVNSIAQSCDVFFYEIAGRVGIDKIAEVARRFGLGQEYGIAFGNEARGLVPTRDWKFAYTGNRWQKGETLITGIGQGFMLATPLQLAVMTARIANGKQKVVPRFVYSIGNREGRAPDFEPLSVNPRHLSLVQEGMRKVHEPGGTAYLNRLTGEGMSMAGKTGTSQVRRITLAEREAGLDEIERTWAERDHALFVSYGPVENPRYALSIIVEHGGGGSRTAAPIAKDLMRKTLELDPMSRPVSIELPEVEATTEPGEGENG